MAADKKANDKQTALESALKQIEKQYGQGAIMRLGKNSALNVDAISTGSLTLDRWISKGKNYRDLRSRIIR